MAKAVSEEEIQLRKRARRRLVGAVTLVIAAVVILPMVLDSKPEQRSQEIDIRIPPEDAAEEFTPGIPPRTKTPAPEKSPTDVHQETQKDSRPPIKPAQSPNEPVERPVVAGTNADAKVESGAAKATTATGTFVVQLGAFSDPVKARQQQQNVASKGTKAYTETLKTEKGEITRVRAGPFPTREEAEVAREKLKKVGLDGVVTDK